MQHSDESSNGRKIKASTICVIFILTSLSAGIGSVNAVGANQNDFYQWWGNGYGDLPDDMYQIQNMSYFFPVQFMSPYYSGIMTAELDVNDDQDWFSFAVGGSFNATLGTYEATEELDVQITYSSTYTSPSNGTVYNNDFQLNLYDSNMTLINTSSSNNPGFVSTSGTTSTSGNCCGYYVQVIRNQGYGNYDTEFWLRTITSGNSGTKGQNDLGYGTDLPDTQSLAMGGSFVSSLNGMSPFYSGVVSGQLDVGDDQDWFVVTLDANEGLEVEINYSPSFTSSINGTVYNNEFDLAIYDSNSNQIDYSYLNNPEIVTTNTSVLPHGGTIYVQIIRYAGYGSYDLELWTWTTQSGGGGTSNQNDLGIPNFDLPDSYTLLQSSGLNPYNLNGAAPYYSGTLSAEFDASGDNEDWFAVTLNTNEWFGIEINYNPFTVINGTGYANQFELQIFDVFGTQINQSFLGTGTAYVSTNNSAPGASIHQGLVYIRMYSLQGFGQYNVEYWTWTSGTPQPSTNQNDVGIPNYDLPDTRTLLLSDPNWPVPFNGMAPISSGTAPAQLNPNDTEDWLSITIDSYESIAFEVSYSPSSVNSGTTYINGVTLNLYDANMIFIDSSSVSMSNSEYVTMNNSAAGPGSHGNTVYVQIIHVSGYVDYDIQFWTWILQSGGTNSNQNDFGYLNYDLPDTVNDLQTDSFWPSVIIGAAPISSGIINAEFDLNGDDNDWLSFALSSNEGLALEISYSSFSFLNSSIVTNDFAVTIYDANFNAIDTSSGNNPEIVTTNNSAAGPGGHGGMIYVHIQRNSGFGIYDIQLWTWIASGGGGSGSGSTGQPVPNPCNDVGVIGSGITVPDILEPNNNQATSSLASILPIYCNGLSFDSPMDEDYFEIQLIAGVTYYVNISFIDANGDIDMEWSAANGAYIDSSTSTSNSEQMTYTATYNTLSYVYIYTLGYSGSNYNLDITTDNPGGGQTFTDVDVTMNNMTNVTIEMNGLVIGDLYQYSYYEIFTYQSNSTTTPLNYFGPYLFTATATTESFNHSLAGATIEGDYGVDAYFTDASGTLISSDEDTIYHEMLEIETTSSTTGNIMATNLSLGGLYTIQWVVLNFDDYMDFLIANPSTNVDDAINASMIDGNVINFTANTTSDFRQISWTSPTSMEEHLFLAVLYAQGTTFNFTTGIGYIGAHNADFIPQLPSAIITGYSFSTTAVTNDFTSEGLDLIPGDSYYHQFRVEDPNGADINYSSMTSTVATAQNMSFGTFYYQTPTISGQYCLYSDLYDANFVQIVGDSVCLVYVFDDDFDGIPNEIDLCPNTQSGSSVDSTGCASSQRDSDGDGYFDDVDDFPFDDTQWLDTDGDGFGDNINGNYPDVFPTDNTQWSDADGDGYGDNLNGNNPDEFPLDPTQWSDTDGDGYGDNAGGNNPDLWPADPSQWTDTDGDGYGDNPQGTAGDAFPFDATQWSDSDNDGYGDNLNGNNPDLFPSDGTQWADADGDGYGDNANGNNADKFPNDSTQWFDSDGDGFGDNQQGINPDAFPSDGTQWADADGDGYGDNQNGNDPDKFPQDSTQWQDADYDGYGDNANGNNPDLCPGTPFGETVDTSGCSTSQTDSDQDGVSDIADGCPNTPPGEFVNTNGCSETQLDDDNDGVANQYDLCSATPLNAIVDSAGCASTQLDSDDDGINDALDSCPATNPGSSVDGFGCAANQRDIDADGVNDNLDTCPNTPISEIAANNGCSESQTDSDLDGVFNDVDQCPNTTLLDLNGDGEFDVDSVGCSPIQYDDDSDMIDNTIDLCPATPTGEQVNADGCSDSQLDEDNDDIWNSDDLCFDTTPGQAVDQNGCSDDQKDDDQDGTMNSVDQCPNTPLGEIIDDNGCSLTQLDTDGDGVNDLEDAFPLDSNESVDTDSDGVPDRLDAYPQDALRSEAESDGNSNGFMFILAAIFAIGVIGALLVIRSKKNEGNTSLFSEANYEDQSTEANMSHMYDDTKEVPDIQQQQEYQEQESQGNQTWEENGVHWSVAPDGTLSYYDDTTQSWILYQN